MRKIGSVGVLIPNLELRIVADGGDLDVEEGQPGEFWVRGPAVMKVSKICWRIPVITCVDKSCFQVVPRQ